MGVREKLVEIVKRAAYSCLPSNTRDFHIDMFVTDLLANGVTVQEWISVKDRLPEDIDTYLVVVKYKYDFEKDFNYATDVATYNPYENAYIDDCWCTFNDWDEGQQYLHITHWMPLPQPPKGE